MEVMTVGHDLRSCTANLKYAFIEGNRPHLRGHRIVIVDTPGFDDTHTGDDHDEEFLRRIAVWLASS